MTCSEFIRNNRGINGGDNLPQEFLTQLYDNISRNEIKISSEGGGPAEASPIIWAELNLQSRAPRGKMLEISSHGMQQGQLCHCRKCGFVHQAPYMTTYLQPTGMHCC